MLEEAGSLTLADGSRLRVPPDLPRGPVVVIATSSSSPSYRQNESTARPDCIAGTREALAMASDRRLHTLDVLAVTATLCIAAPASADLSRTLFQALFG